jgi:hypothetical protein
MNRTTKSVFMAMSRVALQTVHATISETGSVTSHMPPEAVEHLYSAIKHLDLAIRLVNKTPISDFSGE